MRWRIGSFLLSLLIAVQAESAPEDNVPVLIAPLPPLETPEGSWLAPYNLNAFFAPYEVGPIADIATEMGTVSILLYPDMGSLVARFIDFASLGEYEDTIIHHSDGNIIGGGAVRLISGAAGSWDLESVDPHAVWFLKAENNLLYLRRFLNDNEVLDIEAGTVISGSEVLAAVAGLPTHNSPNERLEKFPVVPLQGFQGDLTPSNLVEVNNVAIRPPADAALEFELLENGDPESLQAEIADGWLNLKGKKASDGVTLRFRVTVAGGKSREHTLVVPVVSESWTGYFLETSYWGLGWTYAEALGWLYVDQFPWVHSTAHGWFYCAGDGGFTYIFYDKALGWIFLTPWADDGETPLNQYPYIYLFDTDEWLWYSHTLGNGERWFWSYAANRWIWTFEDEMGYDPPLESGE